MERGYSGDEVKLFQGDCWQHLQNVWIGAVVLALKNYLEDSLKDDLAAIHPTYCVAMDVIGHLQALEKCFRDGANYPEGLDRIFLNYMITFNPLAHVWALSRALGGTFQDIATEGYCGAFMNIPLYIKFLNWKLSCRTLDSILMKNL